ncbi:zinc-binding alcohol dehydrogenase family protein [Mangrovimicrobium sediminis]|uniref:Zinc-type alcohol dehydrogenase-like protein n=2 Tax=Mangrovimicrobium sediminis TaxID=2562682 RepID=A0A4Z0M600_9GAMM|nr:zinc-binding alcohol dehydrogenase family protein [Haliea sp. SAOS-164]TGD74929.1 zinc-binding alcohol dehydrogenase family protein [Haliea sp. SAOS-164]
MRAVGYQHSLPVSDADCLQDIELPTPQPSGRDLLVEVRAVAVNPVDTKLRLATAPEAGQWNVLGFDAAGVVVAAGDGATLFRPGDAVWYAGDRRRAGSNAQYQLVDERLVGARPATLDFAAAAALPLTAITAWELLFDRLGVARDPARSGESLLVLGAAGGVGSMLIQLARRLTGLIVIGSASRERSRAWVEGLGAHHVVDHGRPLDAQLHALGHTGVDYVTSLTHTDQHFAQIVECLRPQGRLGLIDDPQAIDIRALKPKSLSLHWEYMFTRSFFGTEDMVAQHEILQQLAALVDAGEIRTTLGEHYGEINAVNLRRAHAHLESGAAVGKVVLEGWGEAGA